jgi:hypothetical protein
MIDMTQNRVPYGLLTDAEKAALHEHQEDGKFERYSPAGFRWWRCIPEWSDESIYRTVPLPKTQDVIAWEKLPDWVEWVARDADGEVWAYDEEPEYRSDGWVFESSSLRIDDGPGIVQIDDWPGIVQIGTCDWKDSKQRRPQK